MCCSNCKYLDISKKKEGKVSGSMYYCRLKKICLTADTDECSNFTKAYRSIAQQEELEKEGKEYYDSKINIGFYFTITLFLVVLGLFIGIFKI